MKMMSITDGMDYRVGSGKRAKKMIAALMIAACILVSGTSALAESAGTNTQGTSADTAQLRKQIETLESENASLTQQNETLESEKAELSDRVETLESENETFAARIKELEDGADTDETETETQAQAAGSGDTGKEYTDTTTTRLVQQALNAAGFDCGTPDGVAGSKTASAITAYEQSKGITQNGIITDELLETLGIADQVTEAAEKEASKAQYSSDYTYEQLARNPDAYVGDKVKFSGKVLQAETSDTISYMRLAVNSDYDTIIFVTYTSDVVDYRLLEDDMVTIYGVCAATYSYEAVSGATITLPWVNADIIELN